MTVYKLNAKSAKNKEVNKAVLSRLVEKGWEVDNYGHAKKTTDEGVSYRYKFCATVIRFERQVLHEGTEYSKPSKSWVRIKTSTYSSINLKG